MPYGTVNADLMTTSDGVSSSGLYGFKNRIINGAMMIDQRNAGASVTVNSTSSFYACDRFSAAGQGSDGVFTLQQSSTAPTGFKNSIVATVTTADASVGATQYYIPARQKIEGLNVADLNWGTVNAAPVTLSFWVRSSITGTFGGSLSNSAQDRSYPFAYTINAANTFEYKTVTIPGDTTGTWLTTNGTGIDIVWSIGMGSTFTGPAGAWAGTLYLTPTGATNLIGTLGATFYITGVQLEKGSTATSFDYRPYGTELALCQRYYEKSFNESTAPAQNITSNGAYSTMQVVGQATTQYAGSVKFSVSKRAAPTITLFGTQAANAEFYNVNTGTSCSSSGTQSIGTNAFQTFTTTSAGAGGVGNGLFVQWTASSEL